MEHVIARAFLHGGPYDRTVMSNLPSGPMKVIDGDSMSVDFNDVSYAGDIPDDVDPNERDLVHLYVVVEAPDTLPDWLSAVEPDAQPPADPGLLQWIDSRACHPSQPYPGHDAARRLRDEFGADPWTPVEVSALIDEVRGMCEVHGEPWSDTQLRNLMDAMFVCQVEGCRGAMVEFEQGYWGCARCGTLDIGAEVALSTDRPVEAGTVSGDEQPAEQATAPRRPDLHRPPSCRRRRQLPRRP